MQIPISKSSTGYQLWLGDMKIMKLQLYFNALISLVKVPVGGHCILDEQCQGGEHSAVCELGRCVCRTGFVLINLECHEGELEILYKKYKLKRGTFNFRSFHNILICYHINLTSEKLMTYDVFPFHIISSQIFLLTSKKTSKVHLYISIQYLKYWIDSHRKLDIKNKNSKSSQIKQNINKKLCWIKFCIFLSKLSLTI